MQRGLFSRRLPPRMANMAPYRKSPSATRRPRLSQTLDLSSKAQMARRQCADHGAAHACGPWLGSTVFRWAARLRGACRPISIGTGAPPSNLVRHQFPPEAGGRHRDLDRACRAKVIKALCRPNRRALHPSDVLGAATASGGRRAVRP